MPPTQVHHSLNIDFPLYLQVPSLPETDTASLPDFWPSIRRSGNKGRRLSQDTRHLNQAPALRQDQWLTEAA